MRPLLLLALVVLLRLPFLDHPIQGDDAYYLPMAMHGQIDPLHPNNMRLVSSGAEVDMRGYPHPPLNAWILAGLLATLGDVRAVPFHAFYALFSVISVTAVWSLARRFSTRPVWSTLLFFATPAFIVNGSSLESDLPFLAFWLAAVAFFVHAVDRPSKLLLMASTASAACAAMAAYQAVVLAPILAVYLWERRRRWVAAWLALCLPGALLLAWQLWTRLTTGAMPASVLAGYFTMFGLQSLSNKASNAVALTAHLAWIVFPLLAWKLPRRRRWIALAALPAMLLDTHPLFWLSFASGIVLLAGVLEHLRGDADTRFLAAWIVLFLAACLIIFFAGAARYLLPLAAPVAILVTRGAGTRLIAAGFLIQLACSFGLAMANYDHWDGYRRFVSSLSAQFAEHRVWINGEWGLRYYAEAEGGLPIVQGQAVRPGDIVLSSQLAFPIEHTTGGGTLIPLAEQQITSALPFRLIAMQSRSAYSTASWSALRPFDLSTHPIDVVRAGLVVERKPTLSYLPMNAPEAEAQIVSGVYQLESNTWRWSGARAVALLRRPAKPAPLEAVFRIAGQEGARQVQLSLDNVVVAEQRYPGPGLYTLRSAVVAAQNDSATAALKIDRTFRAGGDQRDLGFILVAIGFRE